MSQIDLKNISSKDLFSEVLRRYKCRFGVLGSASLLGVQGSGKTTQALKISEENCWCYINIPDLVQKNKEKLENQQFSENYDDLVISEIQKEIQKPICTYGAVFDNYPATQVQAMKLDKMLKEEKKSLNNVIHLKCPENKLLQRILGKKKFASEEDYIRETKKTSQNIDVSYMQINLVSRYYQDTKKFRTVNSSGEVEQVFEDINRVLKNS